jgi:hypothetical protein
MRASQQSPSKKGFPNGRHLFPLDLQLGAQGGAHAPGTNAAPICTELTPPLLVQTNLLLSLASSRASVLAKCKIFLRSGGACSRSSRGGTGGANRSILTVAATNARQQRHSIAGLGSSSSGCG